MSIILKTLLQINIFASVMILAILATNTIWKSKIHNSIVCILWLLVLARLVVPITLESPVHLDALIPQKTTVSEPVTIESTTPEPVDMGSTSTSAIESDNLSYTELSKPEMPSFNNDYSPAPFVAPIPPTHLERALNAIKSVSIWTYILIVWAIGAISVAIYALVEYLLFRNKVVQGTKINGRTLSDISTTCKAALHLDKKVSIITSNYVHTPVTFGFIHPIVILPVGISRKISNHKLRLVILHELCHIKRKDIFINYLWLIAKTISWFNPLIYLAYKHHMHAIEIACDEMVLKNIGMHDSFEYSESLIDVLRISRNQKMVPVALSFCQDKTKIRKRVENMIRPEKKLKSAGFISILLAVAMVIGCFTTACQPAKKVNTPTIKKAVTSTNTPVVSKKPEAPTITPEPTPEPIDPIYKATDHVSKVLSPKNEAVHVSIDADVEVPATEAFPLLKLEPKMLSQDNVDAFLDAFFPQRESYEKCELSKPQSKADIQKAIDRLENWIATKEDTLDQAGQSSHESWQKMIDYYKTELEKAPETIPNKPEYDYTKYSTVPLFNEFPYADQTEEQRNKQRIEAQNRAKRNNTALINYEFMLEDQSTYNIYALRSKAPNVNAFFINDMKNGYINYGPLEEVENYSDIQGLKTTFDQAQKIAQKALDVLGIDYMSLDLALKCPVNISDYRNKKNISLGSSYHLVYTRKIQGANVTYTGNIVNNPEHDYHSWNYDYFHIWIDDEGIYRLSWHCCPSGIAETILSNEPLLPFEDIMSVAENTFNKNSDDIQHRDVDLKGKLAKKYKLKENNIIIDKIKLGYMKVCKDFEAQEYVLTPVWDFFGRENIILDPQNKWNDTSMPENHNNFSVLTINAIDGSIINRRKGY